MKFVARPLLMYVLGTFDVHLETSFWILKRIRNTPEYGVPAQFLVGAKSNDVARLLRRIINKPPYLEAEIASKCNLHQNYVRIA